MHLTFFLKEPPFFLYTIMYITLIFFWKLKFAVFKIDENPSKKFNRVRTRVIRIILFLFSCSTFHLLSWAMCENPNLGFQVDTDSLKTVPVIRIYFKLCLNDKQLINERVGSKLELTIND